MEKMPTGRHFEKLTGWIPFDLPFVGSFFFPIVVDSSMVTFGEGVSCVGGAQGGVAPLLVDLFDSPSLLFSRLCFSSRMASWFWKFVM